MHKRLIQQEQRKYNAELEKERALHQDSLKVAQEESTRKVELAVQETALT